ncbi:MAG TPA: hypothetical protein VJP87_13405 [Candidatus Acidoferrales bacterium]|nr:hypothetical protein [Candidatus Acidoferrales bacterium]
MKKSTEGWVVYRRLDTGEFVHLSEVFSTRAQAEKEREKLKATPSWKRIAIGVGFVRP